MKICQCAKATKPHCDVLFSSLGCSVHQQDDVRKVPASFLDLFKQNKPGNLRDFREPSESVKSRPSSWAETGTKHIKLKDARQTFEWRSVGGGQKGQSKEGEREQSEDVRQRFHVPPVLSVT